MLGDNNTGLYNQDDCHWNFYHIVDDETLNEMKSHPEKAAEILYKSGREVGSINIYHALVFLGVPEQAVFGIEDIYDRSGEEPLISCVEKDKLPDIMKELENVNIQELEKKFDPNLLRQNAIFPILMWVEEEKENLFKDVIEDYNQLLDIYRKAKNENTNIIIRQYDDLNECYAARVFEPAEAPKNHEQFEEWHKKQYHHWISEDDLENENLRNWLKDVEDILTEAFEEVDIEIDASIGENVIHGNFSLCRWDWEADNQVDAGEIHKMLRDLAKKHNLGYRDIATDKIIFPDGEII
jgi:hypothetical protein